MPRELYVTKLCPFAHRAWLTLIEVGAPHEVKVLDHSAFPDSFGTLYKGAIGADPESDGSVPVIVEDDFVLAESSVIAAFLATKYGSSAEGTALAPSALSAEDHARRQIFLEQVIPKIIGGFFGLLRAQGEDAQAAGRANLLGAVASLSKELGRVPGPYFAGELLSLADLLVWPIIARIPAASKLRGFVVPDTPEFAAYHAFNAAMRTRKSVKDTLFEDAWLARFTMMAAPPS